MNVETLIYAYLAVCSGMILFHCACIAVYRRQDRRLVRHSSRLEEAVEEQLSRVRAGEPAEPAHQALLRRKLRRVGELMAFDETLERLLERDPEAVWAYLGQLRLVFAYLAVDHKYRDAMELTYFAYVIRKYKMLQGAPIPTLLSLMMDLLEEPSVYCRENALQAIYSVGDCGYVLLALRKIDEGECFHHARLLSDGLLAFTGDHRELSQTLWAAFGSFSAPMRVVILDYLRYAGGELREELVRLLADSRLEDGLRLACIRYFGKFPSQQAFPLLIEFAGHPRGIRWEYASCSAAALAAYPGERTVEVLKRALNDANWHVRLNAAKSLEAFQLAYQELGDVVDRGSRYAREILQYRLDIRSAGREGEGASL